MISTQSFLKTHNPVCPVFFAGFESNTYALQKAGWALSMEQLVDRAACRLAMKHEASRIFAISHPVSYERMHFMAQPMGAGWREVPPLRFDIMWMGTGASFRIFAEPRSMNFQAVDAMPSFEQTTKEIRFEDAIPFRPLNNDAPEIVIAKQSVQELMELILKIQDPVQKDIRERRRKEAWRASEDGNQYSEGYRPQADILAQVISIAG
jgi:hypothetical protein